MEVSIETQTKMSSPKKLHMQTEQRTSMDSKNQDYIKWRSDLHAEAIPCED